MDGHSRQRNGPRQDCGEPGALSSADTCCLPLILQAKKKKEREERQTSDLSATRGNIRMIPEEEEEEETRPLSLVYNQERYPIRYDMARWADRAITNGYGKMNFRT